MSSEYDMLKKIVGNSMYDSYGTTSTGEKVTSLPENYEKKEEIPSKGDDFIRERLMKSLEDYTNRCYNCNKVTKDIKACSGCKVTYYCSRECQKKDWSMHKRECKVGRFFSPKK